MQGLAGFNSIRYNLKKAGASPCPAFRRFQFHKVQFKALTLVPVYIIFLSFNSIRYNLKLTRCSSMRMLTRFQFHKVQFKGGWAPVASMQAGFQFHKVQFKARKRPAEGNRHIQFQFHKVQFKDYSCCKCCTGSNRVSIP